METVKGVSRMIGVLLLLQMAGGVLVNFVLLKPVFANPPGFLVSAAAYSQQVGLAVILGLATGAVSVGIAIAAYPIFRRHSQAMTLWFLALAVVNFSLIAVENTTVLSALSLSQAYAKAAATEGDLFLAVRGVVASARNWTHYVNLIIAGSMIFVLYSTLFRFRLVPRVLAAFGLGAAILQITAVTMPLFSQRVVLPMLLPLGLSQLALAFWLITKGFREPQPVVERSRERLAS